ncbi:MAG TPA: L,D-transpeptidase family protein [Xanthobacteraceae bacterium]|nr:L,D-transpeptidase family protein [Xanthobacteraceae bacterium]
MNRQPLVRSLLASAAIAAAIALAGCDTDSTTPSVGGRHLQPLSERILADIDKKNMEKDSPILVRIFKEEAELEVWKETKDGRFALLRTYPICRWSGELGPKIKEGDRQAPEGFYTITPGLMNPNSNYYLAINTGFPNAYDRANGRTGGFLMIHGDCSSRGCYAMTDEQIGEIYALARESFFGGQKSFQIQAYPFRMTPANMAKHRNSPHMAFWKMIKQGYDHFEVTHLEPKVDVCERRYVFNADTSSKFSASDRCPAYKVPEDIVAAVNEKQRRDDIKTAELINGGVPAAPVKMGVDGGMNPTFLAAVKNNGGPGATIKTAAGTIPAHVNPPEPARETTGSTPFSNPFAGTMSLASTESKPAAAPAARSSSSSAPSSSVQVASAAPTSGGIGGFFSNLFGSKSEDQPAAPSKDKPEASAPKSKPAATPKPAPTVVAAKKPEQPKAEPQLASASSKPVAVRQEASAVPSKPENINDLLNGAAPTVPSNGFENRFGAWR